MNRWRNRSNWVGRLVPWAIMVKSEYMHESQQR